MLRVYNKKNEYVKASSLLESVIAITIIATCLLVATQLYTTVLHSSYSLNDFKAAYKVDALWQQTKETNNEEDENFKFNNFKINKIVRNYENNSKIKQVQYRVIKQKDTIHYNYIMNLNAENED